MAACLRAFLLSEPKLLSAPQSAGGHSLRSISQAITWLLLCIRSGIRDRCSRPPLSGYSGEAPGSPMP
jgi:hypothetical protein